jgi:tetratricopeptide (TPR) repeat protein
MADDLNGAVNGDTSVDELIASYLEAEEAGSPPDRQSLLDSHPHLAGALAQFFADHDRLDRLAAPLRQAALPSSGGTHEHSPATVHAGSGLAAPSPERCFGDYEVVRKIAEGGMGVVYEARQKSLNRRVALKVIRAGVLPGAEDACRFRNEAETVAVLDHANIIPVYEVGEHDGRLFFSMKLVEGGSLAGQLDRFKGEPKAAARLLVTVARAVHHAHQRGVLHRDLKPSNILLDGRVGRANPPSARHDPLSALIPYVTDFGLAKRVQIDSGLTQSGAIIGTPSYMAPEQAAGQKGEVTTDVYGLGALLYALLTGRPPFRAATVHETLDLVEHAEPAKPHAAGAAVDRDLETVCLKCLEKQPGRRYPSALALAEELERWLKGEGIQARPIGRLARLRRWCRRNPLVAVLTGGLAGAVALGLVSMAVSLLLVVRAKDQAEEGRLAAEGAQQLAEARRVTAVVAQARADENAHMARQAVDDMYTKVAEEWLAGQAHLRPVQREFLEKALNYYQKAAAYDSGGPALREQTAVAFFRIGELHRALGRHAQAKESCEKAIGLFRQLAAEQPADARYAHELAQCHEKLAVVLQAMGRLPQALAAYRQAIDVFQNAVPDSPPWSARRRRGLASNQANSAMVLADMGEHDKAEPLYRQALARLKELVRDSAADQTVRYALGNHANNLGNLLLRTRRARDALPVYRAAAGDLESLVKDFPAVPGYREAWGYCLENLSTALRETRQGAEGLKVLQRAIAIQERLVGDVPDVPDYQWELASAESNLALALKDSGRGQEADTQYRRAGERFQKLVQAFPANPDYRSGWALHERNLANHLARDLNRPAEADKAYRHALDLQSHLVVDFPKRVELQSGLAQTHETRGAALRVSGRLQEAEEAYRQALTIRERLAAAFPRNARYQGELSQTRVNLAWLLVGERDPPCPQAAWAVQVAEQALAKEPAAGRLWYLLGVAQYRAGHAKAARVALEKAAQLHFAIGAAGVFYGAMAYYQEGDREGARKVYEHGLRLLSKHRPDPKLRRLQAEAAHVLGVDSTTKPTGKGVRINQS